jgi:hypothetical protein
MTIDPKKTAKLDPMAKAFMKFFEETYNVEFVDVTDDSEVIEDSDD